MATSRTIAANGELVEDSEILVTWDGLNDGTLDDANVPQTVFCMLPDVVTGAAGAAVDFLSAIEFVCSGPRPLHIHEYGTGRLVAICPAYGSLVLRSFDVGGNAEIVEWKLSDNRKEIVAVTPQTTIADLAVTDGNTTGGAYAVATGGENTWGTGTENNTELKAELDAMADDRETLSAASFAEIETKVNAILATMDGIGLIHADS